jgi:hypothetical protein
MIIERGIQVDHSTVMDSLAKTSEQACKFISIKKVKRSEGNIPTLKTCSMGSRYSISHISTMRNRYAIFSWIKFGYKQLSYT